MRLEEVLAFQPLSFIAL